MSSSEEIVFSGRIGEVVHDKQPDGRTFEQYRRPPGTRLIIIDADNRILITRERRHETGNVDLRLPGGKVCDSLAEYHDLLKGNVPLSEAAVAAAIKEAREETGHVLRNLELVTIAHAGATVRWDLYYYKTRDYDPEPRAQSLEIGEEISVNWMTPDALRNAISDGRMQEWRSVGVLLGLILPQLEAASR
jgi:8-oxo-dGTP pyrophosphatase MutT (NUDIX family)